MSEVKRYTGLDFQTSATGAYVLFTDYDAALARIATLESDERRRIAGQILAGMYAGWPQRHVYTTGKQALELADVVIWKLEDAK